MTELKPCTCKHEYQQEQYGNLRVHNVVANKEKKEYRCTVCGSKK